MFLILEKVLDMKNFCEPRRREYLMHLVKGVLKHTHLPHIFGCIRLLEHELNTEKTRRKKCLNIYYKINKITGNIL
jgi:hypothetical protein